MLQDVNTSLLKNKMNKLGKRPPGYESYTNRLIKDFVKYKYIYLMLLPIIAYYIVFHYIPMGGAVIAFQNYSPMKGFFNSDWIGIKHFQSFLTGVYAWRVIRNTLLINIYSIIFGFPVPILLALMINEIRLKAYKKVVQTISYMPHFISLVVICGMIVDFSRSTGFFNDILTLLGVARSSLLTRPELFRTVFVSTGIWQTMGWGSIIYIATLSTVDPNLHEAAAIDGASRIQRIVHVSFPALVPVIVIQLIMRVGHILSQGFEKVILLYNPLVYETGDVISSFVYRRGLEQMDFSFAAAVGIFNSIVNLVVLFAANYICRKSLKQSLW